MNCPSCRAENDDSAETCFTCGRALVASALAPGSVVGSRYDILDTLGKGGMGVVYKAHDRVLDEVVALKTMRPDFVRDTELLRRFRSEIKLARKVRHPNVCAIHEYGEDAGLNFISMEFVDGMDLRKFLRDGHAMSAAEAFDAAVQIAQGLQAMHNAGIIHRDLKTPNIMRDSGGRVRLMDFGIAKQKGSETTVGGQLVGTPEYMSPEQARGHKVDFRSDVYALGIVIFEIFTGRVPFREDTPIATILKHLNQPPPLEGPEGARIPAALKPVLRKALAKDPQDRYASGTEVLEALRAAREALLRSEASGTSSSGPARRTTGTVTRDSVAPTVRRPALWLGLAGAVALVGIALVWARSRPPAPAIAPSTAPLATTTPAVALPTPAPSAAPTGAPASSPPDRAVARDDERRATPAPTATPRRLDPQAAPAAAGTGATASGNSAPSVSTPPAAPAAAGSRSAAPAVVFNPPAPRETAPGALPTETRPAVRRGDLVEPGPGVTPPVLIELRQPAYPTLAARLRREAKVVVRVLVDEHGRVAAAEVAIEDKTNLGFNEAAVAAARKSKYRPATKDGVPVRMWSELPFNFSPS